MWEKSKLNPIHCSGGGRGDKVDRGGEGLTARLSRTGRERKKVGADDFQGLKLFAGNED